MRCPLPLFNPMMHRAFAYLLNEVVGGGEKNSSAVGELFFEWKWRAAPGNDLLNEGPPHRAARFICRSIFP